MLMSLDDIFWMFKSYDLDAFLVLQILSGNFHKQNILGSNIFTIQNNIFYKISDLIT